MKADTLTIGRLAGEAGVSVETVRYYHRRGLLPIPEPANGTFRRYTREHTERIRFIKRGQEMGFTLDEVAELLTLNDGTDRKRARDLARAKIAAIEAKVADLQAIAKALKGLVRTCEHTGAAAPCPIIHMLTVNQQPRTADHAGGC